MITLFIIFMLIFGIPALFFLFYLNVATLSFETLGLSPEGAFFLFTFSLIGSLINIPIKREKIVTRPKPSKFPVFFYYPPVVSEQIIAINLGGALIPLCFSIYLLVTRAPIFQSLLCTAIVAVICYFIARPIPGKGIVVPAMVPPLSAALVAMIFARSNPAPAAYIAGTVGTLIGADLLHLEEMKRTAPGILSIGGAGVYDGVFLAGLVAAFLAAV
ncbi:MAG: DUF1614 domain-containing protein [Bacillota bacterium]